MTLYQRALTRQTILPAVSLSRPSVSMPRLGCDASHAGNLLILMLGHLSRGRRVHSHHGRAFVVCLASIGEPPLSLAVLMGKPLPFGFMLCLFHLPHSPLSLLYIFLNLYWPGWEPCGCTFGLMLVGSSVFKCFPFSLGSRAMGGSSKARRQQSVY